MRIWLLICGQLILGTMPSSLVDNFTYFNHFDRITYAAAKRFDSHVECCGTSASI